jgi:hypothetical protein
MSVVQHFEPLTQQQTFQGSTDKHHSRPSGMLVSQRQGDAAVLQRGSVTAGAGRVALIVFLRQYIRVERPLARRRSGPKPRSMTSCGRLGRTDQPASSLADLLGRVADRFDGIGTGGMAMALGALAGSDELILVLAGGSLIPATVPMSAEMAERSHRSGAGTSGRQHLHRAPAIPGRPPAKGWGRRARSPEPRDPSATCPAPVRPS